MKNLISIFVIMLLIETFSFATTYQVDNVGEFNALTLNSGDTVQLKRGTNFNLRIWCISGVIYESYGVGTNPIIIGISANAKNDFIFDGIDMVANDDYPCVLLQGCTNVYITNATLDGNNNATNPKVIKTYEYNGVYSDNINIINCIVKNGGNAEVSSIGGGICFLRGTKNSTVSECKVFNNVEDNIIIYSDNPDYVNSNNLIEKTEVYNTEVNTRYFSGINLGYETQESVVDKVYIHDCRVPFQFDAKTSNNIIKNSIISNGYYSLIRFWCNDGGDVLNNKVYNNILISTNGGAGGDWGKVGIHIRNVDIYESSGHLIKNNIVYSEDDNFYFIKETLGVGITQSYISDNNLFYSSGENYAFNDGTTDYSSLVDWQSSTGQDANSIAQDPLFASTNDFTLTSSSPCINAGVSLSDVTEDYLGVPRPIGAGYDIGAYEYTNSLIKNGLLKNCTIK